MSIATPTPFPSPLIKTTNPLLNLHIPDAHRLFQYDSNQRQDRVGIVKSLSDGFELYDFENNERESLISPTNFY